ncbi:hypothetical protein ACFP1I_30765 [Dyadobacter subterraneus]|uniref:Uncharacterized protein n=1 Tax=Dyadobacter subterraneus TaxID=2773304 RepID=A0ABR9W894_9BACT|nr:hypothetical protein [Dyadobacter subterraneus]MBE9461700.1 hypothetical protein [Dyadobacter subterraneus]
MTRKLPFSKKHFAVTLVSAIIFTSSTLFAQVKIGANSTTIGANSNLEVEATNGNKTAVTKDAGKLVVDGNAQIKTLPAAALTDKSVAADASGNLTLRSNITIAPLGLLTGSTRYTSDQVNVAVNAVRTGNVVCLEGNINALVTLAPNENGNEFRIALIPAGYTPRVVQQGPSGGNFGPQHADAWEIYTPIIYTNGAVGFYLPDAEFTAGHNVSLNGVCYIVN